MVFFCIFVGENDKKRKSGQDIYYRTVGNGWLHGVVGEPSAVVSDYILPRR